MALFTRLRRPLEDTVEMTIAAFHGAMPSHQRKVRIVVSLYEIRRLLLDGLGGLRRRGVSRTVLDHAKRNRDNNAQHKSVRQGTSALQYYHRC